MSGSYSSAWGVVGVFLVVVIFIILVFYGCKGSQKRTVDYNVNF